MKLSQQHWRFALVAVMLLSLLNITGMLVIRYGPTLFQTNTTSQSPTTKPHITLSSRVSATATPTPFMHRPYYGNQSIGQRTVSFVDHDKPWYDNDGIFVRYDGSKWTNVAIGSCTGGINCYDGHNGYDLNMRFEPVLSVAAGTVIRANWYNPLNHNSSLGIWAAIDHGNGYVTAYGHLSALTVSVGDQVGTQWQIGTSGTTGSSTGPHLHMATYYLPNWQATDPFGWTGNYPDPNVVPDNYLWVSNPATTNTVPLLSSNGSAVYPHATLVDDGSNGWSSTGNWTRDIASSDINGTLHWAATTGGSANATATWQPTLAADGYYEIGVFVDETHASSSWVPYVVYSADPNRPGVEVSHTVYLDESHVGAFQGPFSWEDTGPQWISLGTYYFRSSMNGRVFVSNATGENGLQIAADGVEFVPVSVQATLPAPSYGFAIIGDSTPAILLPNTPNTSNVTIKNTSNFSWSTSGSSAVSLLYRWLNAQGQVIATSNPIALPQTVDAGNTATLAVTVSPPMQLGNYTLQWDMVQNGGIVFSQHGAQVHNESVQVLPRYSNTFAGTSLPSTFTPDAKIQFAVGIQNKGGITWPASGANQVLLSYQWLDSAGHALSSALVTNGSDGTLPSDVAPNSTTSIPMTVYAPVVAGNYQLVCDLQQRNAQGGVTTFSSQGVKPLVLSVNVTPTLPTTYYFAEGYTGGGTSESLSLTNPSTVQANITITYMYQGTAPKTRSYQVAAQSHRILNINQEAGANLAFGMIVQGDHPFTAERTMYMQKGSFVAASDSVGATQLSTSWYFADGNTNYGWATLLSVLNPNAQPATLTVNYLFTASNVAPAHSSSSYVIPARARATLVLNQAVPNQQFGMSISATAPVLVERPEYLVQSSMRGGNSVVGAIAPQKTWYFGAGNTNTGSIERLVLANPNKQAASAQISYMTTTSSVVTQNVLIPALTRIEVNVNAAIGNALHGTMVSANAPIIAERHDFFSTGSSIGSTGMMGSTDAHSSWYMSQGDTSNGHIETLALANSSATTAQVQIVYYSATGTPTVKTYTLAPHTSMVINVAADVGVNQAVGSAVYATTPIVVEQRMYFNLAGVRGGYAALALGIG